MIARLIHVAAITTILLAPALAVAQPVVRVNVREAPPHLAGQTLHIDVQVLVPTFFMSPVPLPELDIPGAVVTIAQDSVNVTTPVNGVSYSGIQHTYSFVAQAAGRFTLPPAAITFRYGGDNGPADGRVTLPETAIDVEWPAGMAPPPESAGMIIARVTVTQRLDGDPAAMRAGDALTRTIVTTADRTQPMFIPPPSFTAPDGVRVYPKDPQLSEQRADRGGALLEGRRTDRVVYTFERPGTYVLPAIDVPWFNLQARRTETAHAEAITVTVAARPAAEGIAPEAPAPAPAPPPATSRRRVVMLAAAAIALALLLTMLWRFGARLATHTTDLFRRAWHAITRDRARHLPPLNPTGRTAS